MAMTAKFVAECPNGWALYKEMSGDTPTGDAILVDPQGNRKWAGPWFTAKDFFDTACAKGDYRGFAGEFGGMFGGTGTMKMKGVPGGLRSRSVTELKKMLREARRDLIQARKDASYPGLDNYRRSSIIRFADARRRLIVGLEAALRARGDLSGYDGRVSKFLLPGSTRKEIDVASFMKRWAFLNPGAHATPAMRKWGVDRLRAMGVPIPKNIEGMMVSGKMPITVGGFRKLLTMDVEEAKQALQLAAKAVK